jgi:hypothetical protein
MEPKTKPIFKVIKTCGSGSCSRKSSLSLSGGSSGGVGAASMVGVDQSFLNDLGR